MTDFDPRPIEQAVRALSAVCDGAVTEDGQGFNGTDAPFGNRLAALPVERWSEGNVAEAYLMLAKYRTQLARMGVSYDALPVPPGAKRERDGVMPTRRTWRAQDACRLWLEGDRFFMAFPYDTDMVNAARTIRGRRWEPAAKVNTFPLDAALQLRVFLSDSKREWEVEPDAQALLDGADGPVEAADKPPRGSVDVEDDEFAVFVFEYDADMVNELREIRGRRWVPERRVNMIPEFSAQALAVFLDKYEGFEVSEEVARRLVELKDRAAKQAEAAESMVELSAGRDAELDIEGLGGTLRPFQRAGVAYVEAADGRAFICDDMGTGKTIQALALLHNRQAYPAVIVSPASVKLSWRDHVEGPPRWTPRNPIPEHGWLPDDVSVMALSGRRGPTEAQREWMAEQEKLVLVLNWDILAAWEPVLSELEPKAVVFDECHYAKEVRAARTKAALELSKNAAPGALKLCMSGTPLVNRPKELIAQLRLLDRLREFGGASQFRKRYCDVYWDGYRWNDSGASNLEELNRLLRETCYVRRTKAEVMSELPPKQIVRVPVTLSNPAEYDRAEQETIKFLVEQVEKDREVREEVAALPVAERAAAMRERQNDAAERARRAEKIVRMNLLRKVCAQGKMKAAVAWAREFIDDSDSKLIVFAHHREVQRALLGELPGAARVFGEDSAATRSLAIERFQTDAETRAIVCSLKAAREGITLTAASDVATVELDWTPATHDQAEDRAHRMGQRDSVTCYYLLAEGTIDDDMHELIESKREVTSAAMDGVAKRREMETSVMGALEERLLAKGLKR